MSGSGLFQYPKMVRVQSSGVPYASAKLYFYDTGTVNQKTVYTDEARTIPFTQPVQADAAGQFAPIFIDPTAVYKTTLNTSADVLIETLDPAYDGALSQAQIGAILYPRTAAEIAAGVTPVDYSTPSHESSGVFYPKRYGAAGDANSSGTTGTDDTAALQSMALVINQAGGGTVHFRPGAYYRIFSSTTGTLCLLSGLRGINIQGNGCTLVVPTSKSITASEGYFFAFSSCKNITLNGFNTNGPTLDVSNVTVKGYEFAHFVGCDGIDMPANNIVNALTAATFYGQDGSGYPDAASRSQNIHIGVLKVTNNWYGFNSQFSGDNLVCDMLVCDTVHRDLFIYGCQNVKVRVVDKNHKAFGVRMFAWNDGTHGSQPLKNIEIWYTSKTDSTACGVNQNKIYMGSWGTGACVVDNIKIHFDVEYAGSGQGGPTLMLTKLDNAAAPDATGSRGHSYSNISIDGRILGVPDTSADGLVAMDSGSNFAGETLSGTWRFAFMANASTSYNTLKLDQLSGMGAAATLDISGMNAVGPVIVQQTAAELTLPRLPRVVLDGINCSNRYSNVTGPFLALEYMNAGSGSPTAYAGWCVGTLKVLTTRGNGGASPTTWALPAAAVGMRIAAVRDTAIVLRVDPNGTEVIQGGGAGKYITCNAAGGTLELFCETAGTWQIRSQYAAWTYEP